VRSFPFSHLKSSFKGIIMAPLRFEVNRLVQDELVYELAIRGLTDVGTVEQMRKTLRTLLRLERESNPLVYPVHPYDTATDVTALNNKIRELQSLIDEFDGSTDTVHRKLLSKLAHALGRANRIKPSTPEERKSSSKIIVTLLNFKTDIETKVKRASADQSLGALDVSLLNVDDDEESDGEESMLVTSTPLHAPVRETTSRSHVVPVHKWNLKFSGEDPRLSLSSFLIRVEELRIARHATEEDLYNSAIDLFEGRALTWYRSIRRQASDWKSLVGLLRKQFQPPDYNDKLFDEIRRRTQGADESIAMFVAVMDNLFDRATVRVPEATRLKLIVNNLAPFYQNQLGLAPIISREQLLDASRILEARRASVDSYVQPTRRKGNLLEPDLAYVQISSCSSSNSVQDPCASRVSGVKAIAGPCWNCGKPNHSFRSCAEPRKRFCYRCGAPECTIKTCHKCSGNERRKK
jgi:hypothetical protein